MAPSSPGGRTHSGTQESNARVWEAHTEAQEAVGEAWLLAVLLRRLWAPGTVATVLIVMPGSLLFSLLFSGVVLAVQCVGDTVFVATANDRATEKYWLFLELSFSLKEMKINIESVVVFFFF